MADPAHDPVDASRRVKEAALAAGFDLVGIAAARPLDPGPLDKWLANGWDADLWYMRQSRDERLDVTRVLPGAKSVVAVAVSYLHPDPPVPAEPHGVVSKYARGRDYHNILRRPLRRLRDVTEAVVPGSTGYASCDTRPVMEKAWAQLAGLGWIGKNACLITDRFGSWVMLGCVVTTAELAPDLPHADRCGTCRACLPACPTGAIVEPRFVDSNRCLSFHTIEHQDAIPEPISDHLENRLFGCDLCQDVCPWNRAAGQGGRLSQAFAPHEGHAFVPLSSLVRATEAELTHLSDGTPLARAGVKGLRRTANLLHAKARPR